jgi:hypothetical protein
MQQDKARTTETVKGVSVRVMLVLAILAVFLLALFYITDDIVLDKGTAFDNSVFNLLSGLQSPGTTKLHDFFYVFWVHKIFVAGLCFIVSLFYFF